MGKGSAALPSGHKRANGHRFNDAAQGATASARSQFGSQPPVHEDSTLHPARLRITSSREEGTMTGHQENGSGGLLSHLNKIVPYTHCSIDIREWSGRK